MAFPASPWLALALPASLLIASGLRVIFKNDNITAP
jgi:hypothetical protein